MSSSRRWSDIVIEMVRSVTSEMGFFQFCKIKVSHSGNFSKNLHWSSTFNSKMTFVAFKGPVMTKWLSKNSWTRFLEDKGMNFPALSSSSFFLMFQKVVTPHCFFCPASPIISLYNSAIVVVYDCCLRWIQFRVIYMLCAVCAGLAVITADGLTEYQYYKSKFFISLIVNLDRYLKGIHRNHFIIKFI